MSTENQGKKYKYGNDSMPVKGVIRYDAPDGTFTEMGFTLPYPVFSDIFMRIADWKNEVEAKVSLVEEYNERLKEYLEKHPYDYQITKRLEEPKK